MADLIEANGFRLYLLALGVGMGIIVLLLVVMAVSSPLLARRIQQQLEHCTATKAPCSGGEGEDTEGFMSFSAQVVQCTEKHPHDAEEAKNASEPETLPDQWSKANDIETAAP